uniref:JmjC domain-containing protein n=1 Tax=Arcella intermedia TaxID=1963864 RepID=A0A6B2L5N3_9EUKA
MKEWRQYFTQEASKREAILNVISLEYSHTKLARYIKTPAAIRAIDWIENMWPQDQRAKGDYPGVQNYLLMGAAGSYTNFHIDFGGSSVWYNIVKGEKIFLLVQPTEKNLKQFQKWYLAEDANYFTDNVDTVLKIVIEEGNSIVIPSGWIHAVYTPKDSIAFGGNFLHLYNFEMQLKIHGIEENLQDPLKYRFPYFEELMWYVSQHYVDHIKESNKLNGWERKGITELAEWLKFYRRKRPAGVYPSQYIIDTLYAHLKGNSLPSQANYPDEEEGGDDPDDEGNDHCICGGNADDELWVGCSACGSWYHAGCVGLSKEKVAEIENYYCNRCAPKSAHSNPRKVNVGSKRRVNTVEHARKTTKKPRAT